MMSADQETIRVFVALSLSDDVMERLKKRSQSLKGQFSELNIRWVPFENYHITLIFIGNVPINALDKLEVLMKEAVQSYAPFDVKLGDATLFPPDNEKKGVLITSVETSDPLKKLQSKLDQKFRKSGYNLIDRPYRPHVTLARLRRAKVSEEELKKTGESFSITASHVHLYYSEKRDGRVYNGILRSVELIS